MGAYEYGLGASNHAPSLDYIGDRTGNEGELLQFTISATDPDGDNLSYSADLSSLPSGASFNDTTATFSWTPAIGEAGTYPGAHFEVSDGELADFEDIAITVAVAGNDPPILNPIGTKSVNEDEPLEFTISGFRCQQEQVSIT
jgi:hypothetical protein